MTGERREACVNYVDKLLLEDLIEVSFSEWSSPAFVVPKKVKGQWRLVIDYRYLNSQTKADAHPLPRISEILQRQGKFKIWTVLDMKDGFHQIPLPEEYRDLTSMSTPKGTYRWKVMPMGLKNAPAIFQRIMDYILRDFDFADPYIDDVIIGSTGDTEEELLANHERDVERVLERLKEKGIVVSTKKVQMFMGQVEFCGHILTAGKRSPAPGKLLALQKWELPQVVTQLRGFLGLANYFSEYVPNYANLAGPLTSKLQLKRDEGKKGSQKVLKWQPHEIKAFEALKKALTESLELFQMQVDQPFVLETDASQYAVGAVLKQRIEGQWRPVSFFSRKLTTSQRKWTPREQETYAIVSALRKWAGWIGFQPVLILTDHKALESWVSEHVDTPSGPAGRRARWHETLSKFDIEVKYVPGNTNIVADALSRYAYPASKALQDCSWHGSLQDRAEMDKIMAEEFAQERLVGLLTPKGPFPTQCLMVMGPLSSGLNVVKKRLFGVSTRGGKTTHYEEDERLPQDVAVHPPTSVRAPKGPKVRFADQPEGGDTPTVPEPTLQVPVSETYRFDAKIRMEVLKKLGVPKCSVDLFSHEYNALELDFITRRRTPFLLTGAKCPRNIPVGQTPLFQTYQGCV